MLLLAMLIAFGVYVLIKGILPYKGLKYLIRRTQGEVPRSKLFEDLVEFGTGVEINTEELDDERIDL